MAVETRLQKIVNQIKIAEPQDGYCMGDIWHNEIIDETFSGVKSNNFNIDVAKFIDTTIGHRTYSDGTTKRCWYSQYMSKTQLRKLHAIMVAKSKETLQKRVYAFSDILTAGHYSNLLNRKQIESWIEFCNNHNLEHGLVKVNKVQRTQRTIEQLINF